MAGARVALIIANDEYADPALRRLGSPQSDAEALGRVLGDPDLGDFEVEVLHNRSSHEIAMRLEELLLERRPADVVLIHFSCHGLKDDSGLLYLAAANTVPTRLYSTAVDAAMVNRLIRKSRAGQVVLLLDCCYGGAFERGMVPRAAEDVDVGTQFRQVELGGGRGRAVITASSAMEYAFEGDELTTDALPPPSIFTHALTEGVGTGAADRDQDGMVALGELYDYVYERVREANPRQTPGKWEYGTQGQLVVSRNPHRRIAEAPLPEDLHELLRHPLPAARHGAVHELARLAAGPDLPLAATARAELHRMAQDDSRQVSEAATRALAETEVRLAEDRVDFGTVATGTQARHTLTYDGVPLVGGTRARVEGDGVTARQGDRSVTLTLDTSRPGEVTCSLVLDGPAGEQRLPVTGIVTGQSHHRLRVRRTARAPAPPETAGLATVPAQRPATDVDRRRRLLVLVLTLLGFLGTAFLLMADWPEGVRGALLHWAEYREPWSEDLLLWPAFGWLLPPAAATVCAVLLWFRDEAWAVGVLAGAALSSVLVAASVWLRGFGDDPFGREIPLEAWIPVLLRVLVVVAAVLVVRRELPGLRTYAPRRDARAFVAWAVVLGALAFTAVVLRGEDPHSYSGAWMARLVVWSALVAAAAPVLSLHLPPRPRRVLVWLVVSFCVLELLGPMLTMLMFVTEYGEPGPWWDGLAAIVSLPLLAVLAAVALVLRGQPAAGAHVGVQRWQ